MTSRDITFAAAGASGGPEYVDDVFSTFLYTGNGSTQTINNGIDIAGKGGMVWQKVRNTTGSHFVADTNRGNTKYIQTEATGGEDTVTTRITSFNSNGFSIGNAGSFNTNNNTYCTWTFRKAPKFFDVVTYTGNGANRTIAHSLGSVPGMIIVKRTDTTVAWQVYHRSLANTEYLVLNTTAAKATGATRWNSTTPTSTVFSLGTDATVNANTGTYVAYLFAHDAGGFGAAGTDNVISCGEFTTDGSGNTPQVNLNFEPQYILYKRSNSTGSWRILDNMRGLNLTSSAGELVANTVDAEGDGARLKANATGFYDDAGGLSANATHIYMAIRRPMKPPTSGTQVFSPNAQTGANTTTGQTVTTGFPVDLSIGRARTTLPAYPFTRLTGSQRYLVTSTTAAEGNFTTYTPLVGFANNTGIQDANYGSTTEAYVSWNFRRATGFMDVVCYTGTGSATTVAHNLGVVPELMIIKRRNTSGAWQVYSSGIANTEYLVLNTTAAKATGATRWNSTTPTSSVFSLGTDATVNANTGTYVAYLFASVAGVSKVGSYTGNGSSQTINCGFSAGARFVLIKRTDSTGDWVVLDTARGIVSGNDPFLQLNLTAAEVTDEDIVDPANSGFIVNTTTENINASGGTYIYLAIA
jgi:hypothetical protein